MKTVRLDTSITPNQGGHLFQRRAVDSARRAAGSDGGGGSASGAAATGVEVAWAHRWRTFAVCEWGGIGRGQVGYLWRADRATSPCIFPCTGSAPVKAFAQYKLVGTGIARNDVPDKVAARYVHMQHVRVPGMLHGRVVRPRAGSAAMAPGREGSRYRRDLHPFGIRRGACPAARAILWVWWLSTNGMPCVRPARSTEDRFRESHCPCRAAAGLHDKACAAKSTEKAVLERGDVGAFSGAAHVACLRRPRSLSGACAVRPELRAGRCDAGFRARDVFHASPARRGRLRRARTSAPRSRASPSKNAASRYYEGSGTYGHSCYDDVAQAAAILSQLAERPVRVQFMRWDEHGWDNYGPAHVGEVRAAVDAAGKLVAYEYHGWQHNWSLVETSEQLATGRAAAEWPTSGAQGLSAAHLGGIYDVPNLRLVNHQVPGAGLLKGAGFEVAARSFGRVRVGKTDDRRRLVLSGMDPYLFRRRTSKIRAGWACSTRRPRRRTGRLALRLRMCRMRRS